MSIKELSEENYDDIMNSEKPVLLDFWGTWCGPCKAFMPTVEKFAKDNYSDLDVVKVDVSDYMDLANSFGVTNIPCFVLLNRGTMTYRFSGANREELERILERV